MAKDDLSGVRYPPQDVQREEQLRGVIKGFDVLRGYGFIIPDEAGQPDVWFHASELKRCGIQEWMVDIGTRVSFSMGQCRGKPAAFRLVLHDDDGKGLVTRKARL